MEDPGYRLKQIREKFNLTLRDVDIESQIIAERRGSPEYRLHISRLSEIENHSVVPSIYRIYSLCAIYRLDFIDLMSWYGVTLPDLPDDALSIRLTATHPISFDANEGDVTVPLSLDPGIDPRKTTFLSQAISKWGKVPLALLNTLEVKKLRYALIGTDDWNMYPLIQPGALVTIDESRKKVINSTWTSEFERPIYFMEYRTTVRRTGYVCCWCTVSADRLVLQPHPAALCPPQVFLYPEEIEIIGQVTGVAMLLDPVRRNTRS